MSRTLLVFLCALFIREGAAAVSTTVVDLPTRGVKQRILYQRPDAPRANVILFAGGSGVLGIQTDGTMSASNARCAPTVRNNLAFADHGYAVAAVDVASDNTFAAYDDIVAVVRYMQQQAAVPTWIMGVSSSSLPVAEFAARVTMPGGLGTVLISNDPVDPVTAGSITAPALVVYHPLDASQSGAALYDALVKARPREQLVMSGGSNEGCAGFHSLYGLDVPFVDGVTGFIDRVGPSLAFVPVNTPTSTAIEFYHAQLDHYFITDLASEIGILDTGTAIRGWARTGQSFTVYASAGPSTSPVCRFRIPPELGDSHFYGRGTVECDATQAANPTFINEDPQFFHVTLPTLGVCPPGTRNVYRVFSGRRDANHRYMVDAAIRDTMVAQGWIAEGDGPDLVVMCAAP